MNRTQVAIIGAGPAGLALGHLLHLQGIDNVILENRTREYVEARVRAGVLETVSSSSSSGWASPTGAPGGIVHQGVELQFAGERHRLDFAELARRAHRRLRPDRGREGPDRGPARDRAAAALRGGEVCCHGLHSERARGSGRSRGERRGARVRRRRRLRRLPRHLPTDHPPDVAPAGTRASYPYGWLGILAEVAPSTDELIYATTAASPAQPALPGLSRLYLQAARTRTSPTGRTSASGTS